MMMKGFVVLLKNKEIHHFEEREDYLAFVKDRKDIAWLFGNPKTFFNRFMRGVECVDALDWLDEIDSDEKDRVLDDMEYRDAKESLLDAYKNREDKSDERK